VNKILVIIFAILLALPMSAQVSREGNKYFINGQQTSKKDFATYMQEKAEANLAARFKNGYHEAIAGWTLLGTGLAIDIAGATILSYGALNEEDGNIGHGAVGFWTMGIGTGVAAVGAVCLAVGYSNMHKSADSYIQSQNTPQLTLTPASSGLGLALHF